MSGGILCIRTLLAHCRLNYAKVCVIVLFQSMKILSRSPSFCSMSKNLIFLDFVKLEPK